MGDFLERKGTLKGHWVRRQVGNRAGEWLPFPGFSHLLWACQYLLRKKLPRQRLRWEQFTCDIVSPCTKESDDSGSGREEIHPKGCSWAAQLCRKLGLHPSDGDPAKSREEGPYPLPELPESVVWLLQQPESPVIGGCFPGHRNPLRTLLGCAGVQGNRHRPCWENPEQRGRGMEGLFSS